jgi:hypothetical protein
LVRPSTNGCESRLFFNGFLIFVLTNITIKKAGFEIVLQDLADISKNPTIIELSFFILSKSRALKFPIDNTESDYSSQLKIV